MYRIYVCRYVIPFTESSNKDNIIKKAAQYPSIEIVMCESREK